MGGRTIARRIQINRQKKGKRQLWYRNVRAPTRQQYLGVVKNTVRNLAPPGMAMLRQVAAPLRLGAPQIGSSAAITREEHGEVLVTPVASGSTTEDTVMSFIINPCEAGMFPRLASTAVTYQKYQARFLRINYVPTVGTGTNGSIAFCFIPDLLAKVPESYEDILACGSNWTTPVWTACERNIDPASMAHAFRENYCKIPINITDQEQINATGRLVFCVRGVTVADTTYGEIKLVYNFLFSDQKQPDAPLALSAAYDVTGLEGGYMDLEGLFDLDRLSSGYHMFTATDTANVHRFRTKDKMNIYIRMGDDAAAAAPTITIQMGTSPATLSTVSPIYSRVVGTTKTQVYTKPRGVVYISLTQDKTLSLKSFMELHTTTCDSLYVD